MKFHGIMEKKEEGMLVVCQNCRKEIADGSKFCPECGAKLEAQTLESTRTCPKCRATNQSDSNYCTNCRYPLTPAAVEATEKQNAVNMQAAQIALQAEQLRTQQQMLDMQAESMAAQARCPRCSSTSLSGNKKGYGIGKGVVGAGLSMATGLGVIGLVAGNMGAKKVRVTCMKCGHKFWSGKR